MRPRVNRDEILGVYSSPPTYRRAPAHQIVRLGGVEGTFTLPEPLPPKLLLISAGSGITPIMSMLRSIERGRQASQVRLIHSARSAEQVIFGKDLQELGGIGTFGNCSKLKELHFTQALTNIDDELAFEGCDNLTIYGPADS